MHASISADLTVAFTGNGDQAREPYVWGALRWVESPKKKQTHP